MTANKKSYLWSELYRPNTIFECIFPDDTMKVFDGILSSKEIPNMMFSGTAGTGKTSLARAFCNQLNLEYILINASTDNSIDVIRTIVTDFASTRSILGSRIKVVIIDEADRLSPQAQDALKAFIEEFTNNCRFIFTTNNPSVIIEPLKSRMQSYDFTITKEQKKEVKSKFLDRLRYILETENVEYDIKVLASVLNKYYPDYRKTITELQRYSLSGTLNVGVMSSVSQTDIDTLISIIKSGDFKNMTKWVMSNESDDVVVLSGQLWTNIDTIFKPDSQPQFILHANKYDYQQAFVVDKTINTIAFLTELMVDCESI